MAELAEQLFTSLRGVATLLDTASRTELYSSSLEQQRARVTDPELTPSARVLREMRDGDLPYFRLSMAYSEQWGAYFRARGLDPDLQAEFVAETRRSVLAQRAIEEADDLSFEQYLDHYFAQYRAL
jgi:glutamate--cysteine ligase